SWRCGRSGAGRAPRARHGCPAAPARRGASGPVTTHRGWARPCRRLHSSSVQGIPCGVEDVTKGSGPARETEPRLAREALHVDDPAERDRVAAVVRIERDGAVVPGGQRLLELVRGGARQPRTHDLAAVEGDLDDYALVTRHLSPAQQGRRGPRPG